MVLEWENAAARAGVATDAGSYGVRWSTFDNRTGSEFQISDQEVGTTRIGVPVNAWGSPDAFGYRYLRAHIFTHHADFQWWNEPVIVTVRDKGAGGVDIVGIDHPREYPSRNFR